MNYRYVLDTYAWAELFDGTEKGKRVKELIDNGDVATSIIALAELSDKCAKETRELEPFASFIQAKSAVLPLTQEIALNSGKLKKELRNLSKNVSLADAIHFQTAKSFGATFVTGDPDFRELKLKGILFL
ncbi:PIN domain-containing protein [Candidatus Woesearchaeota archaeon]|nr:PIN domain-containing protein [Candidatus Woesearchaeota archaeon]